MKLLQDILLAERAGGGNGMFYTIEDDKKENMFVLLLFVSAANLKSWQKLALPTLL